MSPLMHKAKLKVSEEGFARLEQVFLDLAAATRTGVVEWQLMDRGYYLLTMRELDSNRRLYLSADPEDPTTLAVQFGRATHPSEVGGPTYHTATPAALVLVEAVLANETARRTERLIRTISGALCREASSE